MYRTITLRGKCSHLDFFWSVFSSNRTEYGPEILRIRTLFTQCKYTISAGTCNCWAFVLLEVNGRFTIWKSISIFIIYYFYVRKKTFNIQNTREVYYVVKHLLEYLQ